MDRQQTALIVGAGQGLSASLARLCVQRGLRVVLAARNTAKLAALVAETGAEAIACDATEPADVERLFAAIDAPSLDLVVYNASGRYRETIEAIDPARLDDAMRVTAFGGFLVAQAAAKRMGIPQPKVSGMMRGDFTNLSERKLMDCLNRLGYDIEIKVRPAAEPIGHLTLATA